jgi:phosphoglucomutase
MQGEGEVVGSVFEYNDPVDKSLSKNQGLIFRYADGSRVIFRQSGTGSVGVTIRIYFEKYEPTNVLEEREAVLKGLIDFGLKLSQVLEISQKTKPDVIT